MRQTRADEGGRPWVVQPELVQGCSMRFGKGPGGLCSFCGITAIRKGPGNYLYMTVMTAQRLAEQIAEFCPNARVEFAMRGEPLMNPNHNQIFSIFRLMLPDTSLMVTTNGDTLRSTETNPTRMQDKLDSLFNAGINLVLLYIECKSIDETSQKHGNKPFYVIIKNILDKAKDLKKDINEIKE